MSISDSPIPNNNGSGTSGGVSADGANNNGSHPVAPGGNNYDAALQREIAGHSVANAHKPDGSCCNQTTSYIHVYHHATDCAAQHAHAAGTECSTGATKTSTPVTEENDKGNPVALVKQIFDNFRFGGAKPEEKSTSKKSRRTKSKVEDQSNDPEENPDSDEAPQEPGEKSEKEGDASDVGLDWDDDLVPPPPPVKRLWNGIDGIAVMAFGVATPVLLTAMSMASCPKRITLVMLNHPIETIIELLLLAAIPLANYRLWSSLCKNDMRFSLLRGLLVGAAIATSLVIAGLSLAAIPAGYQELQSAIGTDFSTGFFFIGMQALATAAAGIYLVNRTRHKREFVSSRTRIIAYTVIGLVLGLAAFAGCEARSWYVRMAEQQALSPKEAERAKGLALLRSLDTERELRMETSDARATGISGLFIPVKHSEMASLYFTVCGKPLGDENSADFSSMSDDYLRRHVVGAPVKGLELARSAFNGMVSPNALTTTINWTYVFRNDTESPQEARAELALPPGAVINGLTVYRNGDPMDAAFAAAGKAEGDAQINWVDVGHDNPAIITDLGRGRYLFHCYPIPNDEQLKVNLSIVVPLKLESLDSTSLTFPRFIASNFSLDGEHLLTLESTDKLSSRQKNIIASKGLQGREVLTGRLEKSQLEHTPLIITARRAPIMVPVVTVDKIATDMEIKRWKAEQERKRLEEEAKKADSQQVVLMIDGSRAVQQQIEDVRTVLNRDKKNKKAAKKVPPGPRYAVRTITEVVSKAPKRLLVVLDGSDALKEHMPELTEALKKVPSSVPVWLRVASRETDVLSKPTPLQEALPQLEKIHFAGGQDNLKAVVNAAEMAGETEGGAVLWIHGPQPGLNKDIYIMSPFRAHPSFFELALDTGCTDTLEYFKNHAEVGPFSPIQRTENLSEDLTDFFSKWQAGRREFVVTYAMKDKPVAGATILDGRDKQELLLLNARSTVDGFIRNKQASKAARIAVAYQFVSPVSCVAVIGSNTNANSNSAGDAFDSTNSEATTNESAPVLQGATNGTIAPQGGDATVIMGVNTAGTVRVNNLANLEALLNIICNMVELAGMMFGGIIILHGLFIRSTVNNLLGINARFTPGMRLAIGAAIVLAGLMTPGLVNWFVASARDANLFS